MLRNGQFGPVGLVDLLEASCVLQACGPDAGACAGPPAAVMLLPGAVAWHASLLVMDEFVAVYWLRQKKKASGGACDCESRSYVLECASEAMSGQCPGTVLLGVELVRADAINVEYAMLLSGIDVCG